MDPKTLGQNVFIWGVNLSNVTALTCLCLSNVSNTYTLPYVNIRNERHLSLCLTRLYHQPWPSHVLTGGLMCRCQTTNNVQLSTSVWNHQTRKALDWWFGRYMAVRTGLFHHCLWGFIDWCNKIKWFATDCQTWIMKRKDEMNTFR